jgi:hypothetical protein
MVFLLHFVSRIPEGFDPPNSLRMCDNQDHINATANGLPIAEEKSGVVINHLGPRY